MEIAEILQEFERQTAPFPRAAVEAAVLRRRQITPELLRILEETVERAEGGVKTDSMAYIYAMFLLAQFRETRAYPLVLRLALLPSKLLDSMCEDFVNGDLGPVLASVCGGELEGIRSLIENEAADQWARGAGVTSLVTLVAAGQESRDEIVSYFASLFRGKLERKFNVVWNSLVSASSSLHATELLDDIDKAFEEDLADQLFFSRADVEREMSGSQEGDLLRLRIGHSMVEDTCAEMGWWACFAGETPPPPPPPPVVQAQWTVPASAQVIHKEPKPGRNDPCSCGSGKKYKKCCGG